MLITHAFFLVAKWYKDTPNKSVQMTVKTSFATSVMGPI